MATAAPDAAAPDARQAADRRTLSRKFTNRIEELCASDPGARSALRTGVRRGLDDVPRMHRLIAPWLAEDTPDAVQRAYYTIAAMIAEQPRSSHHSDGPEDDAASPADPPAAEPTGPASQSAEAPGRPSGERRFGRSLGVAFAEAVVQAPGRDRDMRQSAAESRLNLLSRQSVNGLHRHLPASVRYLRQVGAPIDWAQLLDDLIAWPVHSGRISRRWLQDFYRLRAQAARDEAARADEADALAPDLG